MSDKYKNIDDLYRDKFKDFELDPPEHVWSNIKTQMHGPGGGGNGSNLTNGGIYGITIILILSSILTWYLLNSSTKQNNQIPENNITQVEASEYKSSTRMVSINQDIEKEKDFNPSSNIKNAQLKSKKKQKSRFDISEPVKVEKGKSSLVVSDNIPLKEPKSTNPPSGSNEIEYIDDITTLGIITAGSDEELLALNATSQSEINDSNSFIDAQANPDISEAAIEEENNESNAIAGPETGSSIKSDYGHKANWAFGLTFTPEMIFYPDNNDFNNRSYALDVSAIYKFSGYLLQSGIGVSWTSDEGNCEIDYNEYLGSYENVYNVTFDTTGSELSPIYHTETVRVYDSIERVSIMPTKNHYTYLQIPLLFGYGNENRRFGWFVKGGPSLSIMINENLANNNVSSSEDKILQIENEIPARINTNWQFVFSGGVSYKLSNHLSFTAEPVFRYYLNSTYERNKLNLKNPYSFGLRIGFLIDL